MFKQNVCRGVQNPFIMSEWNKENMKYCYGFLYFDHTHTDVQRGPYDFHTANIVLSVS